MVMVLELLALLYECLEIRRLYIPVIVLVKEVEGLQD